jgi:hypothetical protein
MPRALVPLLATATLSGVALFTMWGSSVARAGVSERGPLYVAASRPDPLHVRARSDLESFTAWLARGGRRGKGVIGEVGWPGNTGAAGDTRWNELARDWYRQADAAGLWVSAWATGDFWASSYKLLTYAPSAASANAQAHVIEGQREPRLRGLNVAGAEFATPVDEATSRFSNVNPGTYGRDYVYPSARTLAYLAGRGITFVRLPVRWERLQPSLGRPLDPDETRRLAATVDAARAHGLRVVIDVHNYGAYYVHSSAAQAGVRRPIGSREVPIRSFADLWSRVAARFADDSAVLGYGLMNEPVGMRDAQAWETASRAAVHAIRDAGSSQRIFVQSYFWGGVRQFAGYHPSGPWIGDANTWYEAHQYFDHDRSARYRASYDEEVAQAAKQGFTGAG